MIRKQSAAAVRTSMRSDDLSFAGNTELTFIDEETKVRRFWENVSIVFCCKFKLERQEQLLAHYFKKRRKAQNF